MSATQLNSSLLTISVIAVLLPAAFHSSVNISLDQEGTDILGVSHGVSTCVHLMCQICLIVLTRCELFCCQVAIILLFSKLLCATILHLQSVINFLFLSLWLLPGFSTLLSQESLPRLQCGRAEDGPLSSPTFQARKERRQSRREGKKGGYLD